MGVVAQFQLNIITLYIYAILRLYSQILLYDRKPCEIRYVRPSVWLEDTQTLERNKRWT